MIDRSIPSNSMLMKIPVSLEKKKKKKEKKNEGLNNSQQ
jgi:hypothetical protein